MPNNYSSPGVYVEEVSVFPPSVAQVETAIPAFIGYTAFRLDELGNTLAANTPVKIKSLTEYHRFFGRGPRLSVSEIRLNADNQFAGADITASPFYMYDALQLFYANGGGDCYIVSVGAGGYPGSPDSGALDSGLTAIAGYDEPTILLFPDAVSLTDIQLGDLQSAALQQCGTLKDRVGLFDLRAQDADGTDFRSNVGINNLKYGAAYTPWLRSALPKNVTYAELTGSSLIVTPASSSGVSLSSLLPSGVQNDILTPYDTELGATDPDPGTLADYEQQLIDASGLYKGIISGLNALSRDIPPSGAIAGVYATVDRTRGVWKAPANISLNNVIAPTRQFSATELDALNIDTTAGKSINAIRSFSGKGVLVWGARTLAGNDNEWRYISVRRFYNMAEESVKKATEAFVFESNSASTWVKVRAMIENFLTLQWRAGALAGAKADQAFFVRVGLGETMTAQDINEGKMIVDIGMAVVRPAEFIIIRFSHKMQGS